jgi:hypothetical protein
MLFTGATPERFVQDYRSAFQSIELEFRPALNNGRMIEFSPSEQDEIRRDIALHWIRYCLSTRQEVQVRPRYLHHPQTWEIVLRTGEAKYGSRSEDAMALAAHTVGEDLESFQRWRRVEDDRAANM